MLRRSRTPFSTMTEGTLSYTSQEERMQVRTMRDGVDLRRLPNGLIRLETALRVDEVGREDSVDERRLSETSLTCSMRRHGQQTRLRQMEMGAGAYRRR